MSKLAANPFLSDALELIEADDEYIYDVVANVGQIVGNVRHMRWFARAVAESLKEDAQ